MNEIIDVLLEKKVTVALLSSPETCVLFESNNRVVKYSLNGRLRAK